jgi:hypothetical protein
MSFLLNESGIRNINQLAERYDNAKIYFHQDLDGVTTAIAMKNYLEQHGIKVVETEVIQYGDKEFSIKKPMAKGDIMPVLVDFAHGKPMFVIHTDHHDTQVGVEKETSKSFRQSRSNVETISQIVSPKEIFPHMDILMISTVDSANFVNMGITPEQVMNYVFVLDKEKSFEENKKVMALVANKLLLAYKNKPKFLERLVMESSPSLLNVYQNIVKIAKEDGYASPEVMSLHSKNYVETMKKSKDVKYDPEFKIISQYGGGSMIKPGSYDRYVPFKNFPDANFLVIVWPLGLLQSSCNPFKEGRSLKGVNLGEIAKEVLLKFKDELDSFTITVDTIKYFAEKHKEFNQESVGFTYNDLMAIYGQTEGGVNGLNTIPKGSSPDYTVERWRNAIKNVMQKPYETLSEREIKALKMLSVTGWDMIQANSGGHKCITNISGLMYFGKQGVPFLKRFQEEFVLKLKEIIMRENTIKEEVQKNMSKEEFSDLLNKEFGEFIKGLDMKKNKLLKVDPPRIYSKIPYGNKQKKRS